MRPSPVLTTSLLIVGFTIPFFLAAQEPGEKAPVAKDPSVKDTQAKGMPPRAAASEYQAHAEVGAVTIVAEFMGHAVPTPEQTVAADDYVVVEAGLFGQPGARATLSRNDFSLRINGKKAPLSSEPYELVFKSLKDPEWQPPVTADSKSKGGLSTGGSGGGSQGDPPPLPPKMPFELRRAMELHVQRASLQEGDRALPQAGLLFFAYRGKVEGIHTLELIYSGAAGKATLELQP